MATTPWVILSRYVSVGADDEEARAERAAMEADADAGEEAEGEADLVAVNAEAEGEVEQLVAVNAQEKHAAAAAEPDLAFPVVRPPGLTVITAGRGAHPDAENLDNRPCVIAAGPLFLLLHFSGPFLFGKISTHHLAVARQFATDEGGYTASVEPAPPVPSLWHLEAVALVSDEGGGYTIAELQIHRGSRRATLIYLRSVDMRWCVKQLPYPFAAHERKWVPHGAVTTGTTAWWFDLSRGILSCDLSLDHPQLVFHRLPFGRALGEEEMPRHVQDERWITRSRNKLRYVEIIPGGRVCMWTMKRAATDSRWEQRHSMNFEDVWKQKSYTDTSLPRNIPVLAVVCPSNPDLIYFSLEQRLFGVDVPTRTVLHWEMYRPADVQGKARPATIMAWHLGTASTPGMHKASTSEPVQTAPELATEPNVPLFDVPGQSGSMSLHQTGRAPDWGSMLPSLPIDSENIKITEVWRETSQAAFSEIKTILRSLGSNNCFIAIGTEFCIPDGVHTSPYEPSTADGHYSQLLSYVHGGDLVQVGIGFADTNFNLIEGRMFQINLFFDPAMRSADHPGVQFMRNNGLNFDEHARRGLPALEFIEMMQDSGALCNNKFTWVSFMGYPDVGFMINLLTNDRLPETREKFLLQVTEYFPSLYDCKFFSKYGNCIKKKRVTGKLELVAEELGAKRTGKGHQAASDALLTLRCFCRLKALDPDFYTKICGVLYGVCSGVITS